MTLADVLNNEELFNEMMMKLTIKLAVQLDDLYDGTYYIVADCEYDEGTIDAYKIIGYNMKSYKVQFDSFAEAIYFRDNDSAFDWIDDSYRLRQDTLRKFEVWRV